MAQKKTWREKLADSKDLPRVAAITEKMRKRWGSGTVVIPAPKEVDEIMKKVPSVVSQKFVQKIWLRHQAIFLAP